MKTLDPPIEEILKLYPYKLQQPDFKITLLTKANRFLMKALLIFIPGLFFQPSSSLAQDTLYYKNGNIVIGQLKLITETLVKFSQDSNEFIFVVAKSELSKLVKANGETRIFNEAPILTNHNADPIAGTYGRNFVSITITDVLFKMASLSYERISPGGRLGLNGTVSIGKTLFSGMQNSYDFNGGYYSPTKLFNVGVDLNYYPMGQGMVRYFIGPSLEYGQLLSDLSYYSYNRTPGTFIVNYEAILLKFGLLIQPTKSFNFGLNAGLGPTFLKYQSVNRIGFVIRSGFFMGYKF